MNKRIQGLLVGIVMGAIIASGAAFAKQMNQMAELSYSDIKIYIDGVQLQPKDVNGNPTEPFTMNGSTYLPVRAVAGAFGKDVEWEESTQSVYIGKKDQTKPDTYLDRLQYSDYRYGDAQNDFQVIKGGILDYDYNDYYNGLLFYFDNQDADGYYCDYTVPDDPDNAQSILTYDLNSLYTRLTGKIVLPSYYYISTGSGDCWTAKTDVWFYGDGKLLYKASQVTETMPFSVDIDLTGVNRLTIKLRSSAHSVYAALTDLALYK